jgi:hypothetical protein
MRVKRIRKKVYQFLSNRLAPATWCIYAGGVTQNPIVAHYLFGARAHIIDVPLPRCRAWGPSAFVCDTNSNNPFVDTLVEYHDTPDLTYDESPLRTFYERCIPESASQLLGIDGVGSTSYLASLSPYAYVFPWENVDLRKRQESRTGIVASENRRNGFSLDVNHGHPHWGPVTPEKGAIEFRRLTQVYISIQENGFRYRDPKGGTIAASAILSRGKEWCVHVRKGNRRIAALAALGYSTAPIRFGDVQPAVIRRDDVDAWPQVRSGVYQTNEALLVFDRLFDGTSFCGKRNG